MWSPTSDTVNNFMDALRYSLLAGEYTLRIEVTDPHAATEPGTVPLSLKLATPLTIHAPGPPCTSVIYSS